jgi:hypothetical protein
MEQTTQGAVPAVLRFVMDSLMLDIGVKEPNHISVWEFVQLRYSGSRPTWSPP